MAKMGSVTWNLTRPPTISRAIRHECGYTSIDAYTFEEWNGYGACPCCQSARNSTWALSDDTTIRA